MQLAQKEAQGRQEAQALQDFQDSQEHRVIQDLKEERVKRLSPRGKQAPQGIRVSEGHQGERAWRGFQELQD